MFRYQLICDTCNSDSYSLTTPANDIDTIIIHCADCGSTLATLSRYALQEPQEEKDTDDEEPTPID